MIEQASSDWAAVMTQSDYIIDHMQISLVITVLNEAATIEALCQSIANQSLVPTETIIVDGGSTDDTVALLENCKVRWPKLNLSIITKPGNRSVGRNYGIHKATSPWIAITDAGCAPESNWLAELVKTQQSSAAKVVAGYYHGIATTPLSQAIIPYVLVMPDQIDPLNFLPATRSMLLHRSVWKQLGGFDESLSHNEDYVLARKMQSQGVTIGFAKKAVVRWQSRQTLPEFWTMIYRFAWGDAEALCWRPKVALIFGRYASVVLLMVWLSQQPSSSQLVGSSGVFLLLVAYLLWAIKKNLRYAPAGWYWLPILQLIADLAVMTGTTRGLLSLLQNTWHKYFHS